MLFVGECKVGGRYHPWRDFNVLATIVIDAVTAGYEKQTGFIQSMCGK